MNWPMTKLTLRRALAAVCHRSGFNAFLRRHSSPSWRILTYHRITTPADQKFPLQPGMYVQPQTFAAQMKYLKSNANVISLEDLLRHLLSGAPLPDRAVVITFDDGWLDNYTSAFPVLRELQLPATIFLATEFIGTNELFWTDRISQSISALSRAEQYREQILGRLWGAHRPPANIRTWVENAISLGHLELDILDNIISEMKSLPPEHRRLIVEDLRNLTKEFTNTKNDRLFADWTEIITMSEHGITFGSHSHHHQPMSELTAVQLRDDLAESYQAFRDHNLKAISSFCYPGGYWNQESQSALHAHGVSNALLASRRSDLKAAPVLLGRIHLHEDICSSTPLFTSCVWGPSVFSG